MQVIVQYEWLVLELVVLGFLFYQLWSVRRSIRRDKEKARLRAAAKKDP